MFHLFTHAFFKALLFLSAGVIVHSLNDEQDIRKMGNNLFTKLLGIFICFIVGNTALVGLPPYSGFYSKELIIENTFIHNTSISLFAYLLCTFSTLLTAYYSARLTFYVFFAPTKARFFQIKEPKLVLYLLSIFFPFSAFIGLISFDLFFSFNKSFFTINHTF